MFAAGKTATPSGGGPDAQFNYVTMLLHGDGTNGAQNNTFVDSSTNNFTITRNGNTTQGSFSPYGSNWSNYFDGTGDYVQTGNATNLALGTGNFTIEGWFNRTSGSNNGLFQLSTTVGGFVASDVDNLAIGVAPTDLTLYANNSTLTSSTVSIPNGIWNHFALVRSGTTTTLYYNGVSVLSLTDSKNYTGTYLVIGGYYSTTYVWNGYISNLRIVKGTAVYTSNFTPPTAPLSAITNTQLLTCQANRFIDSSVNAYALTVSGNTSVQRFNPFGASTAYSTSVIGGSGYFDGSGDYLTVPNTTNLNLGNTFTIEAWVYSQTTSLMQLVSCRDGSGGPCWQIVLNWNGSPTTGGVAFKFEDGNVPVGTSSDVVKRNAWTHIAVCRNGTSFELFCNGVRVATGTSSTTFPTPSSAVFIGSLNTPITEQLIGYMSDFRMLKGTALYTGTTYTVPTAPLTAITNTQLLTNYTNAAIIDNAMMSNLETVGNAQISTSVKKYGTGSLAFDGTGDYLNSTNSLLAIQGSIAFTLEAWIYPTSVAGDLCIYETRGGSGFVFFINSGGKLQVYDSVAGAQTQSTTTLTANTWTFISLVRAAGSSTVTYYVDGTSAGTFSLASFATATRTRIGAREDAVAAYVGYMDDFRITIGYARYTSNFTPPTSALSDTGPY